MEGIASSNWSNFLQEIKLAKEELGKDDIIWYRGHSNAKFYLLPSLLRYKNGIDKEQYLFDSFRKLSDRVLQRRESDWETLFEMQHYHIPTRLLDWSETFGIALFFAAYYSKNNDAAIYLLNPLKLNKKSSIRGLYKIPVDEDKFSYKKIYWDHDPFAPQAPIAVEPIFLNDRILAQKGMFTVHHNEIEPIESKFPEAIKKITLPADLIPAALEFLDLSNLNQFTVFPDLQGIAEFLRSSSGLEYRYK